MRTGLARVMQVAESEGWDVAVYQYALDKVAEGDGLREDERAADWRYLLPDLRDDGIALVLGCGLGTIPVALCEMFAKVYAADVAWDRVRLLELRAAQHCIANLFPVRINPGGDLPFEGERFDLVVARSEDWDFRLGRSRRGGEVFESVARQVHGLLTAGGAAYWTVENALDYQRLLRPWQADTGVALSRRGYRRALTAAGFMQIRFYAPLPSHKGVPLFYLPLEGGNPFEYFFRHLFPLFEMVSPEVKRLYAGEYALVKLAASLALRLRLTRLALHFVPGFGIVASRGR